MLTHNSQERLTLVLAAAIALGSSLALYVSTDAGDSPSIIRQLLVASPLLLFAALVAYYARRSE